MKASELLGSKSALAGVGLLAFAVLAVLSLSSLTEGGEHPLALETEVDLCGLLGEEVWVELRYPASDTVARVPAVVESDMVVCALELDPVAPGDRWARVARGDDADEVRRIATVTLTTTGTLRDRNPEADTASYVASFDQELVASGWASREVTGPWSWGSVYTMGEEEAATLVEDDGVVLWTTASGVEPENLVAFMRSVTQRVRPGG